MQVCIHGYRGASATKDKIHGMRHLQTLPRPFNGQVIVPWLLSQHVRDEVDVLPSLIPCPLLLCPSTERSLRRTEHGTHGAALEEFRLARRDAAPRASRRSLKSPSLFPLCHPVPRFVLPPIDPYPFFLAPAHFLSSFPPSTHSKPLALLQSHVSCHAPAPRLPRHTP